ncbi:hypothetical protein FIBSPDRAFT_865108 [Athelia psychrophila]|uniref:Uncharacterized protein n=1 Tax=Athelia psychrophila TaxID=1759441 RepID=A0A166FWH4_9AGAM|nr:hypothetical protein FIBSPDRAFT_865108 [Fibularhizoctonia sp. CBS 109695]
MAPALQFLFSAGELPLTSHLQLRLIADGLQQFRVTPPPSLATRSLHITRIFYVGIQDQ